MVSTSPRPKVVILGGGFAGLHAARALRHSPVQLTLIDRRNHHLFQPLLYQVATAVLNPSDIASPIRSILKSQDVEVILAEATSIDAEKNRVILADGEVPFDYLVIATGATHSYFGHSEWSQYAPGLKSIEDALEIRRRVLLAYEAAERETDPARRKALLTFVIIGGGPTGVELAGALAEIARQSLANDFKNIDPTQASVVLIEGLPVILPSYAASLSKSAEQTLERLGVRVRTSTRVTLVDEGGVYVGDERIAARTVLWAAGVQASNLGHALGGSLDKVGRVKVELTLQAPNHPHIYVIGDLASLEQDGAPIPGVAPAAIQQGDHAGKNVARAVAGKMPLPFHYWDKGTFSVIGRGEAVGVAFRSVKMSGFLAWLTWLFVHLFFLIGFKNRVAVLFLGPTRI